MIPQTVEEDPSRDFRYEMSRRSGLTESIDKVFFSKLASGVVDADRCVQCASCILACPSRSIAIAEDDHPTLVRMCTGCSLCWDFCPRGGLRYEKLWSSFDGSQESHDSNLGSIRRAFTARAVSPIEGAQDGGVVTAMLRELFLKGDIDGAIVARRSSQNPLKGEAYLARSAEDLQQCTGSYYNQTLPLDLLKDAKRSGLDSCSRLALVGTPCEVTGVKVLQRFPWKYRYDALPLVKFTIALMCTRNFNFALLIEELKARGFDVSRTKRMDVKNNAIRLYDDNGNTIGEGKVRALRKAALRGCDECADFSGRMADISVGAIGSQPGYCSVLVRTENGERVWRVVQDVLHYRLIDDLGEIKRVEGRKREIAVKSLKRRFDSGLPMKIEYSEHLSTYAGSDREPVKPASYRIHHYDTTC